ncbi:hypothetical protein [Yeosuana marina]|uniref:hypothetical protein n=1 Tax=Yeosuana marina TaxID=1565536 RepID=UPI0030EB8EE8|tara:strand:- start:551 stop:1093 length:543 start_codon:yes stop_codon:yes gene_type:complete
MKKIIHVVFFVALLFTCKNNNNKEASTEVTKSPQTTSKLTIITELQKLKPLSNEQLRVAFPEQLYDLKLDKEPVITGQSILGHFGGRKISLEVTDATGESHKRAVYFLNILNNKNFEDTPETKYIKKERSGISTFAKQYTEGFTELDFLYKNRFLIHLLGEMTPDELWQAFDMNELKNFK